jgi:nitroreductase
MGEDVLRFITERRSVREFTGEPVERAKLEIALKAAMAAPSARNSRPWQFVVIMDQERVRTVCETHPYAKFGVDAGAVILPFGKKEGYRWFDQDMGAATENLLVALAHLGLGATWCGMSDERQEAVRALTGLPDDLYVFALIPVGVPAEEKPARTQYEPERVHWEQYQRAT